MDRQTSLRRSWALFSMAVIFVLALALPGHAEAVVFLGPSEYLCFDDSTIAGCGGMDSPFAGLSFSYFHLEDFEDHLLNTPGVSGDGIGVTSVVFGPSIHDSVDADDGLIDGSGLLGDSYFSGDVTFTFDAGVLGSLPTHAGVVWTDGSSGVFSFEAFGADGSSLGSIGPFFHADGTFGGTTIDDRFYGVIEPGGISAIKFVPFSAMESDHLQYGLLGDGGGPGPQPIPEPTSLLLFGLGTLGLGVRSRRKRA